MKTLRSVLRAATELAPPRCVAEFSDYARAQDAADRLARAGIPEHEIAVVGRGPRSVRRSAVARLAGAARLGAGLGAWCGLAFAMPLLLDADVRGFTLPISTAILGALVGLVLATIEHGLQTRGGAAPAGILADHYEVRVARRSAEQALRLLAQAPARPLKPAYAG